MSNQTENSTEKTLDVISEKTSIYAENFTQIGRNNEDETRAPEAAEERSAPVPIPKRGGFSGKIFKWRNAIAVAAIFAVGVLHFVYQMSFQTEIVENSPPVQSPVISKTVADKTPEVKQVAYGTEKTDRPPAREKTDRQPARKIATEVKSRQTEIAPARPQSRKKVFVESRAARLRRAEKILTGV